MERTHLRLSDEANLEGAEEQGGRKGRQLQQSVAVFAQQGDHRHALSAPFRPAGLSLSPSRGSDASWSTSAALKGAVGADTGPDKGVIFGPLPNGVSRRI